MHWQHEAHRNFYEQPTDTLPRVLSGLCNECTVEPQYNRLEGVKFGIPLRATCTEQVCIF